MNEPTQICTACNGELPTDDAHFHRHSRGGWHRTCKTCKAGLRRERYLREAADVDQCEELLGMLEDDELIQCARRTRELGDDDRHYCWRHVERHRRTDPKPEAPIITPEGILQLDDSLPLVDVLLRNLQSIASGTVRKNGYITTYTVGLSSLKALAAGLLDYARARQLREAAG